jgi:hypothetical protein
VAEIRSGLATSVKKIAGLTGSQWAALLAGLVNLAVQLPAYVPTLAEYGFNPTPHEKGIIALISVAAGWIGRSLLASKSGVPGDDPNTPQAAGNTPGGTPQ